MLGSAHNLKNHQTRTKQAVRLAFDLAQKENNEELLRENSNEEEEKGYLNTRESHAHFVFIMFVKVASFRH